VYKLLCIGLDNALLKCQFSKDVAMAASSKLSQFAPDLRLVFALDEIQALAGHGLHLFQRQGDPGVKKDALHGIVSAASACNSLWLTVLLGTRFSLQTLLSRISPAQARSNFSPAALLSVENMWGMLHKHFSCLSEQHPDKKCALALDGMRGRPRWFVKYGIAAIVKALRSRLAKDAAGVHAAIIFGCQQARRACIEGMVGRLQEYANREVVVQGQSVASLLYTLYEAVCTGGGTLNLTLHDAVVAALDEGVLALPAGTGVESGTTFTFDVSSEPILADALEAWGDREIASQEPMRDPIYDRIMSTGTDSDVLADKGAAAERAWTWYILRAVKQAKRESIALTVKALLGPAMPDGMQLPADSEELIVITERAQPYSNADVFKFSRANPTHLITSIAQTAGADLLLWCARVKKPDLATSLGALKLEEEKDEPDGLVPMLIQVKAADSATLMDAVWTTLPSNQFVNQKDGKGAKGRDAFLTFMRNHAAEMESAIRVVATNRTLLPKAIDAVTAANELPGSKKSPLVVVVANGKITGRSIVISEKKFGPPGSPLPQPDGSPPEVSKGH
jgi:hypothetical protein